MANARQVSAAERRSKCYRREGTLLRARLIGAMLLGVAVLPGAPAGHAAPAEQSSGDRLEIRRLADMRERLERRRALQRNLQGKVEALAAEIDALRAQQEQTSAALESKREQARALEQRLDRLVPRLLARVAEVSERRVQAAGALAEWARKSRSVRLGPRIRARMLALSPLLLERLRTLDHGAASLRGRPDRMIARHAQIEGSLPALMSAQERLQRERTQKRRLRQMASARLRVTDVEVRLLGEQRARLARRLLREVGAMVARAEPGTDQRAVPDLAGARGTPVGDARVDRDSIDPSAPVTHVADARNRAVAAAPEAGAAAAATELAADVGWPTVPLPAESEPRRAAAPVWPGASRHAVDHAFAAAALDVHFSRQGGLSGRDAGRAHGPHYSTPPLLPMPDGTKDRALIAHGGPGLTIPAVPGQAVAAPVEGRVVFAGRFKSYGLLLILEHEGEYHTLLWGFARLDVHHGDAVQVGQIVGMMDARGDDPPVLHVERRRNGRPIDIAASSNGIQG